MKSQFPEEELKRLAIICINNQKGESKQVSYHLLYFKLAVTRKLVQSIDEDGV